MAQTGYTPILIYSSSTGGNAPAAGNLTNSTLGSELAINITDGKLFYKDNANAVQVIGWKTTPTTAGGTGLTSYSQGDLLYYNSGTALTTLAKNTTATRYLSNTGTNNNPAWAQVDLTNGVTGDLPYSNLAQGSALSVLGVTGNATADVASIAAGTDHQVLRRSGTSLAFGAVALNQSAAITGTLPTGNGGTGLTSFTANGILYASSTSALATSSNLTWDGSNVIANGGFATNKSGGYSQFTPNGLGALVGGYGANNTAQLWLAGGVGNNGNQAGHYVHSVMGSNGSGGGSAYLSIGSLQWTGSAFSTLTEQLRLISSGYFKATNNGSFANATGTFHEFYQSADNHALIVKSVNATQSADVLVVQGDRNTTNNSYYVIQYYNTGGAVTRFRVADSGNVTNTNGSYGTISDAKIKQDIIDAPSQWDDIKNLRLRKYRLKSEASDNPDAPMYLGLVAQEVEAVSPGLVEQHQDKDADNNNLGTVTKSIKTSILYMKAVKALQETMARIELLETQVQELKGK